MNKPKDNKTLEQTGESEGKKKSSRGCCFFGCLFMFLFMTVVVVGGGFGGYWWFKGQLNKYTSEVAADLPIVDMSEEEIEEIENRIDNFKDAIEASETPEDLVLTANEINAMISQDDDMRGRVYITIADGTVSGDVSIPTDFFPGGKGRFFNASATFEVSLENSILIVTLTSAKVKGEEVPQEIIEALRKENLAKEIYKDPEVAATLRRIESITIKDDKIILKPRVETASAGKEPTAPSEPAAATETDAPEEPSAANETDAPEEPSAPVEPAASVEPTPLAEPADTVDA
jgi:hypothetical protein